MDKVQKIHYFPSRGNLGITGRARWTANIQMRDADILRRDLALVILAGDHRILEKSPEPGQIQYLS